MAFNDRQVMWTALPAGIVNGIARVSVYVSPRLSPPATVAGGPTPTTLGASATGGDVARYAEFLHWASLSPLTFQVQLDQMGNFAASCNDERQPALWDALFPASTPVAEYSFQDFSKWNIVAPPTTALVQYILDTYQAVAQQSPNTLPTLGALAHLFNSALVLMGDKGQKIGPLAQVRNALDFHAKNPAAASNGNTVVQQLAQLYSVLKPSWPATILPTASTPTGLNRPTPPILDFHQILSALGSYPRTLRMLGIVFDLTLDAAATEALKNSAKVRVLPTRAGGGGRG